MDVGSDKLPIGERRGKGLLAESVTANFCIRSEELAEQVLTIWCSNRPSRSLMSTALSIKGHVLV